MFLFVEFRGKTVRLKQDSFSRADAEESSPEAITLALDGFFYATVFSMRPIINGIAGARITVVEWLMLIR
jgi:hypothetical protein